MKFIPNVVSAKLGRQLLITQKHSPTLLFAGGVAGVITTTVLACRATLKLDEVLEKTQDDMKKAKDLRDKNKFLREQEYTEHDYKQDMLYLYIRSAVNITKLYAPSILVGAASIGALAGSHALLNKRNAALTAAYAAVERSFSDYRKRVVAEHGEDKDREYRHGSEERTIVEDTDKGPKKVQIKHIGGDDPSGYARFFDEYNMNWSSTPEYNMLFLRCQQNYANDRLRAKGHLLLNEVYDMLGIDRSKAGCVVGWIWDPTKSHGGDNYVDFGIWDGQNMERFHDFVTGREGCILLDFNVDGIIYDKI